MKTVKDVMDRLIDSLGFGTKVPEYFKSRDLGHARLLTYLRDSLSMLVTCNQWNNLIKEHEIKLDGSLEYDVKPDFMRLVSKTAYSDKQNWAINSPTSAAEWQLRKKGTINTYFIDQFRFLGNQKRLKFIEESSETITFEYYSNSPIEPRRWEENAFLDLGEYFLVDDRMYKVTFKGNTGTTAPTHLEKFKDPSTGLETQYVVEEYSEARRGTDVILIDPFLVYLETKSRYEQNDSAMDNSSTIRDIAQYKPKALLNARGGAQVLALGGGGTRHPLLVGEELGIPNRDFYQVVD